MSNQKVRKIFYVISEKEDTKAVAASIDKVLKGMLGGKEFRMAVLSYLEKLVPVFFYFSEYSRLPYSVNVQHVLKDAEDKLNDHELTARALLRMAGVEDNALLNTEYERRKRELENVANALTDDVLKYWSQNTELRVQPDITTKSQQVGQNQQIVIEDLKIRIWDNRHFLSLPFDEHSTGFQWFFSFLAAFSEFDYKNEPLVILLDEPALGLHARAQADFLRFIRERLAPKCQVIYTTHSPFMVQPSHLEAVRLVEDHGREKGSKITREIMGTDPDTLFPLQGALGYDMVQHLFIAPHNLVVEGTSDFTYLLVISDYLKTMAGRTPLDDKWSIVPVGGADMVPTFVALLGTHLEVTVLVDSQKAGHQRLASLAKQGYLNEKRIITIGEILARSLGDIEDLFTVDDYLMLYNPAFGQDIKPGDLKGSDPIVNQIARYKNIQRFDHGRPADLLLRRRDELLSKLSSQTLDRFESLFIKINSTLK